MSIKTGRNTNRLGTIAHIGVNEMKNDLLDIAELAEIVIKYGQPLDAEHSKIAGLLSSHGNRRYWPTAIECEKYANPIEFILGLIRE